jgi:hypothetical protein
VRSILVQERITNVPVLCEPEYLVTSPTERASELKRNATVANDANGASGAEAVRKLTNAVAITERDDTIWRGVLAA